MAKRALPLITTTIANPATTISTILTSGRLRDQWHTQTRSGTVSRLRDHEDRPWLDLHPDDAATRGFRNGDAISIISRRGRCIAAARLNKDIRQGCVSLDALGTLTRRTRWRHQRLYQHAG